MAPHASDDDGYKLSASYSVMENNNNNNNNNNSTSKRAARRGGGGQHLAASSSPHRLFATLKSWHDEAVNEPPSWEALQETERQRRDILQRVELPFGRILMHWKGTCLRSLLLDWMVWVPMLIFVAIRVQARTSDATAAPGIIEQLQDSDIDILGGFLSFLLVLFVNQTNTRFFAMYQLSKAAAGRIQDVAGLVATRFPPPAAHRLVRYLNAAHVAGYVGLGGPYSQQHFFEHFNQQDHLLTAAEWQRLDNANMDAGSATFKELVTWCQRQVHKAHKQGHHIDTIEAAELDAKILDLRAAMDGIYDYCDQPTHFFYVHS